jgi:hypothetical protein
MMPYLLNWGWNSVSDVLFPAEVEIEEAMQVEAKHALEAAGEATRPCILVSRHL